MSSLPYPHARHDCIACRERDADVIVLADAYGPCERPATLCNRCVGMQVALQAAQQCGDTWDQPVTFTVALAPGRRATPAQVQP